MSISIQNTGADATPKSVVARGGGAAAEAGSGAAVGSSAGRTREAGSMTTDPGTPSGGEDAALAAPKPPRFPWLSRLSQQLESASKTKPAFEPAPLIGENVDKKV